MQVDFSIDGNAFTMRKHKIQVANTLVYKLLPCKLDGLFDRPLVQIASRYKARVEVKQL